jgi:hypothetical protein
MGVLKWVAGINAFVAVLVIVTSGGDAVGPAFAFFVGGTVGGMLYLLPLVIAVARGHLNTAALGALNVLLGWTVLGWVAAFVWALSAQRLQVSVAADSPGTSGMQAARAAPVQPVGGQGSGIAPGPTTVRAAPVVSETKLCPLCAEVIKAEAVRCKHCHADLTAAKDPG